MTLPCAERWYDGHDSDPDAVAMGIDPEEHKARMRAEHLAWAKVGRGICERFLDYSGVT